jgi:hypothetical protein
MKGRPEALVRCDPDPDWPAPSASGQQLCAFAAVTDGDGAYDGPGGRTRRSAAMNYRVLLVDATGQAGEQSERKGNPLGSSQQRHAATHD